jgi:prophage antirepressor-like protein
MTQKHQIQLFEEKKVRTVWDDQEEKWYFSIVDVCAVLAESKAPQAYWRKLKQRLKDEGNETVTNCHQLKLRAEDGKMRSTDVADNEQLFRLVQSIPSKKAEPFKQWMAQVAAQRIDQMQDPELNFEQAYADYRRLGYSDKWINQRLRSIEVRKELTDEWDEKSFLLPMPCCWRCQHSRSRTISGHGTLCRAGEFPFYFRRGARRAG